MTAFAYNYKKMQIKIIYILNLIVIIIFVFFINKIDNLILINSINI